MVSAAVSPERRREQLRLVVPVSISGDEAKIFHEKVLRVLEMQQPKKSFSSWVRDQEAEYISNRIGI